MGAVWEQQGCLKLSPSQGLIGRDELAVGKEYPFRKERHRLYMLDTPIELVTDDWQVIARVEITKLIIGNGTTQGVYKVLKVYSDEEARVVSGTIIRK